MMGVTEPVLVAMRVALRTGLAAELRSNKKGSKRRMKKTMLLGVLMLSAAAGYAQESRQDVSFSGTGIFAPVIHGAANVQQSSTGALGLLLSYRYMVTPHSALEANYSFAQNNQKFSTSFQRNARIHSRQQEVTVAYVYSLNFKRFSPFATVSNRFISLSHQHFPLKCRPIPRVVSGLTSEPRVKPGVESDRGPRAPSSVGRRR